MGTALCQPTAHLEQLWDRALPFRPAYDHLVPTLAVVRSVCSEHARKLGLRSWKLAALRQPFEL